MKNKQMKKAVALILSASITMTSVSWNHLLTASASEVEESMEIEPEEATAEDVIEKENTTDILMNMMKTEMNCRKRTA